MLGPHALPAADVLTIGPIQSAAEGWGQSEIELPELRWMVLAPKDTWGTTVQFSCGPFVHAEHPLQQVDCRIHIRLLQDARAADWRIDLASDETAVAHRDLTATVSASSRDRGSALLGLRATFVPRPGIAAAAGEYVAQGVGLTTGI